MHRRILAVIVLYKTAADDSISFTSLLKAARQVSADELDLSVILYDNTPGAAAPKQLPSNVEYVHDSSNSGLAAAYNYALAAASKLGCEWLFTLNQDTELPPDSLRLLLDIAAGLEARPDVAAIVPQFALKGALSRPPTSRQGAGHAGFQPDTPAFPNRRSMPSIQHP